MTDWNASSSHRDDDGEDELGGNMFQIPPSLGGEARYLGHDLEPLRAIHATTRLTHGHEADPLPGGKELKPGISRTDGGASAAAPAAVAAVDQVPSATPSAQITPASAVHSANAAGPREGPRTPGDRQPRLHRPWPEGSG